MSTIETFVDFGRDLAVRDLVDLRTNPVLFPTDGSNGKPNEDDHDEQQQQQQETIGVVLICGSWNRQPEPVSLPHFAKIVASLQGFVCRTFTALVCADSTEDDIAFLIGDNDDNKYRRHRYQTEPRHEYQLQSWPIPPERLPALALVYQSAVMPRSELEYIPYTASFYHVETAITNKAITYAMESKVEKCNQALRIFVAGDRSSVGKSSISLGLLGSLLSTSASASNNNNEAETLVSYAAQDVAYIKPATQSESTQLVQLYCEKHEIACQAVGPLVYYRGFTRAFLQGETETTEQLLERIRRAVDLMAVNKKVVLVDGVGFPAVGSICGTDNATVARASGYPVIDNTTQTTARKPPGVLIVGGPGVGAAVDGFSLNATFFEYNQVPVLGAVFNKLPDSGFYSLEQCRIPVTAYFEQHNRKVFGFVPVYDKMKLGLDSVDDFLSLFRQHVNVTGILESAKQVKEADDATHRNDLVLPHQSISNKVKLRPTKRPKLNRSIIEDAAIAAGAAPSA